MNVPIDDTKLVAVPEKDIHRLRHDYETLVKSIYIKLREFETVIDNIICDSQDMEKSSDEG